jgi:hypothetical protein
MNYGYEEYAHDEIEQAASLLKDAKKALYTDTDKAISDIHSATF